MRWEAYCLLAALCAAQSNNSDAPKTGGVSGVVVDANSGDPVRKAIVILRRDEPGTGATTDAAGKFVLRDLEPGSYTLTAERSGYVVASGKPQTVTVKAGETTPDMKLTMARTGAISGRIVDTDGEPARGVNIQVFPARKARGGRPVGAYAATDDRGEYRAFDIAPGEYHVSATHFSHDEQLQVRMQRPAAGAHAGEDAYPTVYYPGAVDVRQASTITVAAGAELHGIDIQLVRQHAVRVRGRVAGTAGSLFTMVMLQPRSRAMSVGSPHTALLRGSKAEFELIDVLPGAYILSATSGGTNQETQLVGYQALEVGDADVENVELTVGPPHKVAGRLMAPEGRHVLGGLMVMLSPRDARDVQAGGTAQVSPEATFSMDRVAPGDYDVMVGSPTPNDDDLYISAIRMGDADALTEGVHIGEAAPASLDIILKANGGTAECKVEDDKGAATSGANVFLVPDEPRRRQFALYGNCRTEPAGTCKITGITPGAYHIYAFPEDLQVDYRDPDSLRPFEKFGKAVTFEEGQRQELSLRPAGAE